MGKGSKESLPFIEYLPYILLIFGLVVIFLPQTEKKVSSDEEVKSSDQASVRRSNEERVNRYLKDAFNKKQLEEIRVKNELGRTNPAAGLPRQGVVVKPAPTEYSGGDIEPENKWGHNEVDLGSMTPEETIQYQLKLKQEEAARTRQEQEAFIEQFVENARRNGLEVQVDQNLKVKSIKKIRQ